MAAFDEALLSVRAERGDSIGEPSADGFVARYFVDGIEIQTGASLVSGLEARLDRIESGHVDWVLAKIAMGILEGMPLHGEEVIAGWRRRLAYSDALRRREIEANAGVFPIWRADTQLAHRDAEMFRRQMLVEGAFRVVAMLSALNRAYFSTFQFKRAGAHFDAFALKPGRLGERLDAVVNAPPAEAAAELRALVEETKALVRREMPDVDVDRPWLPNGEG